MPELPEVQTVVNYLNKNILGLKIKKIHFYIEKILKNVTVNQFKKDLINSHITSITRKGKYIIINISNNLSWIVHLRMEGKFYIKQNDQYIMDNKHLVCEIFFDNFSLCFYDTRRFATFHIIKTNDIERFNLLTKVNIDPLDNLATGEYLFNKLSKLKTNIKTSLLNQSIISGIGNIYVDEILFKSKISPFRISNKISLPESNLLIKNAKEILLKSISLNGTTISTYNYDGVHSGGYQDYLLIHNPKQKICKLCNKPIIFEKNNGRGTYWCKTCQK